MGHSDDFGFAVKNIEFIEIVGNFGCENFQGISFDIFLVEYRIRNPELDILTLNNNSMILNQDIR